MSAKGARRSTGTKGARMKILSTLHPNTILKANPDPNAHPNPKASLNPTPSVTLALALALTLAVTLNPPPNPNPSPSSKPRLGSELVLGSKTEGNDVAKSSNDLVQPNQHGWHG